MRLSTANDEIVEVLLSKHQVLAALRFITGVGRHDSVSARKFLNAAKKADDMLFIPYSGSLNKEIRGYERTLISPQENIVKNRSPSSSRFLENMLS
ncbi:unnamed protein product [Lepidochelys olivacea]